MGMGTEMAEEVMFELMLQEDHLRELEKEKLIQDIGLQVVFANSVHDLKKPIFQMLKYLKENS